LVLKGAKVYVGARNEEKAMSAIREMAKRSPSLKAGYLHPLAMDLGNFKAVQEVARNFVAKEDRLDILVNNAAM
jgi:NAD(P)-dependent dehydrogenase (short-subunit alcohol dehydrogenase family)